MRPDRRRRQPERESSLASGRYPDYPSESYGYTEAEKSLAANYAPGDVVAFHRAYKRLGVEKGDEHRVASVDHRRHSVMLDGGDGGTVLWQPSQIAGRTGGVEVYRAEQIELRAGDRIRWTRNDPGHGLVNSRTAEVLSVQSGAVMFKLEDGRALELGRNDPQLRHLDHAWAHRPCMRFRGAPSTT